MRDAGNQPDFSAFARQYEEGKAQVVWTTLVADLETPVSAFLKLADGRANSFLFESVEGGEIRGRYSFIGLKPDLIWRCRGDRPRSTAARATTPTLRALRRGRPGERCAR